MGVTLDYLVTLCSSGVAYSEEITVTFMKHSPKHGAKFVWKETEKTDRNKHSPENEEVTVIQQICRNCWKKQVCVQLRILEEVKNPTG